MTDRPHVAHRLGFATFGEGDNDQEGTFEGHECLGLSRQTPKLSFEVAIQNSLNIFFY